MKAVQYSEYPGQVLFIILAVALKADVAVVACAAQRTEAGSIVAAVTGVHGPAVIQLGDVHVVQKLAANGGILRCSTAPYFASAWLGN